MVGHMDVTRDDWGKIRVLLHDEHKYIFSRKWRLPTVRRITVPPENIYPFTEVLPRPIHRLTPRSRLGKDAACRNFTEVLPRFATACNIAVNGKTR